MRNTVRNWKPGRGHCSGREKTGRRALLEQLRSSTQLRLFSKRGGELSETLYLERRGGSREKKKQLKGESEGRGGTT